MYLNVNEKWEAIKQHITNGIASIFPIKTDAGSIELLRVEFKEPNVSTTVQRSTLLSGKSLTCNVYGLFRRLNANGHELEQARVKILDLPVITHRGTFIVLGKDYSVFNQMRLKPGVYTKKSEDTEDVTTSFNLGKGLGFKLSLSPSDGVFYVRFDKSRASSSSIKIPLYSLLRALGVSDDVIKQQWGDKIYQNNISKAHLTDDIHKIVTATVYEGARTGNDTTDLRNYFNGTLLDKETTKITLGASYGKVESGALLDAAKKMLRVYNGQENEDDMDSLLFKEVLSVEDHLGLRIEKGIRETNNIMRIKRALSEGKSLKDCIPINFLSKLIESFFTKSSLASPQAEINPIEVLETNHKITAMGEGGIKSEHGIPMSARNLHPSHFGFLDPVRTTESTRVGVDLRTTHRAVIKNKAIYAPFINSAGKEVMLKPTDLAGKVVGFAGQEGKPRVQALRNGEMIEIERSKVDYWMGDAKDTFTYTSNLTPFMHNDQGNRITMASRFETQAVPLVNREEPYVQVKSGTDSIEHKIGMNFLTPRAPESGKVTEVADDHISINGKKVEIYHIYPLNEKCVSGNSLVTIKRNNGSLWIGFIKNYEYKDNDLIQSIDPETKKPVWAHIAGFKRLNNDKQLFDIKLASGRHMVVTEDHSLVILKDGKLVKVTPTECMGGMQVPVVMLPDIDVEDRTVSQYNHFGILLGHYLYCGYTTTDSVVFNYTKQSEMEAILAVLPLADNVQVLTYENKIVVKDLALYSCVREFINVYSGLNAKVFAYKKLLADILTGYLRLSSILCSYEDKLCIYLPIRSKSEEFVQRFILALSYFRVPVSVTPKALYIDKEAFSKGCVCSLSDSLPATHYDRIVSAEKAKHEDYVYDLEIDSTHMFAINLGIIVHNTYLNMKPIVKVGDTVVKGQPLADSNFTKHGTLSLGTNLVTAYIPYKGWNHEDGIVISESASKKLTSQHMYTKEVELNSETFLDKNRFIHLFPSKINPSQIKKLDDNGVAIQGETYQKGDPLVTILSKKDFTKYDMMLSKIQGALANPYRDSSIYWDHDRPGTVTDVVQTGNMVKVVLITEDQARVGDKLSNRHGGKGTITKILPDAEMPKLKSGQPVDQLLNPAGVISRVNSGQLFETMAGKIADHAGKIYLAENFSPKDSSKLLLQQLKENHLKAEEPLYDGRTGKKLGDVFTGNQYTLKLHKMTEGNFAARSTKAYDVNMQPARGGESGAKAVGLQDVYALLGHNARANLREMAAYKSQDNAEFWNAIKLGLPIPKAKEPFAFEKFKAIVGASGIDVTKDNSAYSVKPLSDAQVLKHSNGAISSGTLLVSGIDKYKAEQGGLFDERITGGKNGKNWSHINLAEPVVNPLFTSVVKTLLHVRSLDDIPVSKIKVDLAKIDMTARIAQIRKELPKAKGSPKDKLLKELKYLVSLKKMNMKPEDYVLTKFPVIPPQFRPIYDSQGSGSPMVSDVNYLYRDMINVNKELANMKEFPDSDPTKQMLKKTLQQAAGAIVGTDTPVNKKSEKQELQGYLPLLTGSNINGGGTSKESFFHRKIMKRNQDMTGRGTILPDPNLHIDNVKIPREMAKELYKPFVINNLVKHGYNVAQALQEIKKDTSVAKSALSTEMGNRPVLLNRAPTLHKYNILAFKPLPVEGKSIFIPPLVIKGFAADFDGDSVAGDTQVLVKDDTGKIMLKEIKNV